MRFLPFGRPGSLRLFGWLSRGTMGSYDAALAARTSAAPYPDLSLTRATRTNEGVVASAEQELTDELGVFARASFSPGRVEIMGWTDCDQSASLGAALKGSGWGRPADALGVAGVVEGLSPSARRYFAAGGMGILIGDGRLSYRPEAALEVYYSLSPLGWAAITADYQLIVNPGYNADRAPLSVFSARLHASF